MVNAEHRQTDAYEDPNNSSAWRVSGALYDEDPRLLRFSPYAAGQLREFAKQPDYEAHMQVAQHALARSAFEALGLSGTGGFGIVEAEDGKHYISLWPEDLGKRLVSHEIKEYGLPELAAVTVAKGIEADTEPAKEVDIVEQPLDERNLALGASMSSARHEADVTQKREAPGITKIASGGISLSNPGKVVESPDREIENSRPVDLRQWRDHSLMEETDVVEMRTLSEKIVGELERFSDDDMDAALRSADVQENGVRNLLMNMRETINRVENGQMDRARAHHTLDGDIAGLLRLYAAQATIIEDRFHTPLKSMKEHVESDLALDVESLLQRQDELNFNTDTGELSYLKERVKRATELGREEWAATNVMEQTNSARVGKTMYHLRNLIDDFQGDQWGVGTIVMELKAVIEDLDQLGYNFVGRLAVFRQGLEEAREIVKLR